MHLLRITDLQIAFETELGTSVAVQDSSFTVDRGVVVAIVGESGSGKSVTSLSILQLLPAKTVRYPKGSILFSADGEDAINILDLKEAELRNIRGSQISMIFQEPMTSLNPVFTCGEQVIEAILQHTSVSKAIAREQTLDLFSKVKLPDPESVFKRYRLRYVPVSHNHIVKSFPDFFKSAFPHSVEYGIIFLPCVLSGC